jgi:hypothetical protein
VRRHVGESCEVSNRLIFVHVISTVDIVDSFATFVHMNTWTPLFSKIVDSSVWTEPDNVVKVFLTMMALKDADQVVRYNAFAIGQRAHKTEAEVLEALEVLAAPDKKRIEPQPHEGRRVEKVEGGWLLLNGQYYEDMMRSINRRAYKTGKQREYRAKGRGNGEISAAEMEAHVGVIRAVKQLTSVQTAPGRSAADEERVQANLRAMGEGFKAELMRSIGGTPED